MLETNILDNLKEINHWVKTPKFDKGYTRTFYIDKVEQALNNKLIKVITGQRRSGKSFIVRQIMELLLNKNNVNPVNIFYLNKEQYEYDSISTALDLSELLKTYEQKYQPEGKIYILIDEIQNIKDWEKIIVSLAQNPIKDYEIIITGSNSSLLSGELSTLLSGRYLVMEVFPFSYCEYLDFGEFENNKESFINYITTSGLPELHNLNSEDVKRHYFLSLKDTVLLRDIMHRHKIRDYVLLEDIFLFLLHNVGNMTSISSIIKYFKSKRRTADYTTISNYIAYLQDAYILHEAPRYSLKNKELLSGEKKYFVNDLGFRNYLFPNLLNDIGAMLENVVYLQLRKSGYEIKLGYENNFEVDFYAAKSNIAKYIQVTYLLSSDQTIKREFGALERIKDHFPKYVISMDDIQYSPSSGIIHEQVWDFIYKMDS